MSSGVLFILIGTALYGLYLAYLVHVLNKDPKDKYGGHI
jgi:hypothetical protein